MDAMVEWVLMGASEVNRVQVSALFPHTSLACPSGLPSWACMHGLMALWGARTSAIAPHIHSDSFGSAQLIVLILEGCVLSLIAAGYMWFLSLQVSLMHGH